MAARAEAEELKMLLAAQEAESRNSVLEADIRMAQVRPQKTGVVSSLATQL